MTSLISIIALGFLLGMRHATDPDHVVAVATIVSRERRLTSAAWVGLLWGLGHTFTIVLVSIPIIFFNWVVPPRVGLAMEFAVGIMLMLLGLANVIRIPHTHSHDVESPSVGRLDRAFGGLGVYQALRPFVIGIFHGLAGSAAVALLVLAAIRDAAGAVVYLLVFGAGTAAGMMLITTAMAIPFARSPVQSSSGHRRLRAAVGLASFAFGVFLAYKIGVVQGLFSAAPQWTPD